MMISIIIPTYNRSLKLRNCLESLRNQTYKNFEVIICDDGSTDDTKDVVQEFTSQLNIIYDYDINFGGPARPRNRGIKIAKGDFLAFLDSDDWWYPNKLEVCNSYLKNYDFIYHNLDKYDDNNKNQGKLISKKLTGNLFHNFLIYDNPIFNSSVLLRKEIADKIGLITEDKNLIAVEDFDYWIRVSRITDKFKYIPVSLGGYLIGDNISNTVKQVDRDQHLLNKYLHELPTEKQQYALSFLSFRNARVYHSVGMFEKATFNYKKAMKSKNFKVLFKSLIGLIGCYIKVIL